MAGLIPAHLILDAMDGVMDAHGQGRAPVQGLMDIGGLVLHDPLQPIEVEAGRDQKGQDLTGLGHGLVRLVAIVAAVLVDESYHLGTWCHMK